VNLLLVAAEELRDGGQLVLVGRRAEHLRNVLRVVVGQKLRAGLVRGGVGEATVRAVSEHQLLLDTRFGSCPEPPTREIILALPRPKVLPRILQAVASFGVRRVGLVNAWRVDAAYFESHRLAEESLREQLLLGCEQGRQTYLPEIAVHRLLVPFFRDNLAPRLRSEPGRVLLVGHPDAEHDIEEVVQSGPRQQVTLFVGPDGGFVQSELRSVADLGAKVVRLGSAVLRTEVAVVALMSQLDLLERLACPSASD
jgi:16S rRNA (uracil1498-N3)-methyltransferase